MIAIVDYKAGNLTSVAGALDHLGHRCEITDRPEKVRAADRVILPGVGAAGATMENLRALGLDDCLRSDVAKAGRPFSASASASRCCSITATKTAVWIASASCPAASSGSRARSMGVR